MRKNLEQEQTKIDYSDFITTEIHYNERTLLTKNGELVKFLKIEDAGDIEDSEYQCMRDTIRKNLKSCFNHNFYIYIYTVRTRRDVYPKSAIEHEYANKIYKLWGEKNNWHNQLTNTLYIAIVLPLNSSKFSLNGFSKFLYTRNLQKKLEKGYVQLHSAVKKFSDRIFKLKPKVLTCIKKEGKIISEPISFLYYLIHLEEKECELKQDFISNQLSDFKMTYGLNTFEVDNTNGKQFGLMLTFKDIQDMSIDHFDKLLNIGSNVIITEFIRFVPSKIVKNYFAGIHEECNVFIEEDENYRIFNRMMEADKGNTNDYYEKQLTYLLYTDRLDFFDNKAKNLLREINNLGINAVREDFMLPVTYWSRIPGNFKYIKRRRYDYTEKSAIFSSIHPSGIKYLKGSKWGDPITILRTQEGFPYFFNFHVGNEGNTSIISTSHIYRDNKLYFLLLLSQKFSPKISIIDFEESNEAFLNQLNALNMDFANNEDAPIKFDVFDENNFLNYSSILTEMFTNLFEDDNIGKTVSEIMSLPHEDRFEKFHAKMEESIKSKHLEVFESFFSSDEFSSCLSENLQDILEDDLLFEDTNMVNLNLSQLNKNSMPVKVFTMLLLMKLITCAKSNPSIIVLKKFSHLLDNKVTLELLKKSLENAVNYNAVVILCDDYVDIEPLLKQFKSIQNLLASQMFTTTIEVTNQWKKVLEFSESEFYNLRVHKFDSGKTLLLQGGTSTVVEIDTKKLNDEIIQ